nr:heterogeneous nuclear ribonucleoprotein C-like isoform X1 [Labrus bergylta]
MKSCKPEPGELSSLNSSTSSKKDDSLKRERESQDSDEEGDLLEDEDEIEVCRWPKRLVCAPHVQRQWSSRRAAQMKSRGQDEDDEEEEEEEGEDDGDSANGDDS